MFYQQRGFQRTARGTLEGLLVLLFFFSKQIYENKVCVVNLCVCMCIFVCVVCVSGNVYVHVCMCASSVCLIVGWWKTFLNHFMIIYSKYPILRNLTVWVYTFNAIIGY